MTARPVVLNTRPEAQAAGLTQALETRGFAVLEVPVVEVVPLEPAPDVAAILETLRHGGFGWTVLPSANAATFLLDALQRAGGGAADLGRTRVLGGTATARALADRGVRAAIGLPRFSAAAALRVLEGETRSSTTVLLPRAVEGREELAEGLRARGVRVRELPLYTTRRVPAERLCEAAARLRAGRIDLVTFTSPSTVRGLVDGLLDLGVEPSRVLADVPIVCLGETTATAVRAAGLPAPRVAALTGSASLADAALGAWCDARAAGAGRPALSASQVGVADG